MQDSKHFIFKTLDNPPRILYWSVDEFILMIAPVFFGIVFGSLLLMLAALLKVPYARFKRSLGHSSLVHCAYWHLPTDYLNRIGHFKSLPPSHERNFLL